MSFTYFSSSRSWIEDNFSKRECVSFIPACRDLHRCYPVCQVCHNLIRCWCGRLIGEHFWLESGPPESLCPGQEEENWSMELHTSASPTNAYGTIDFQDSAKRACRAKYVRVSVDSNTEALLQLMLKEWQMERPKLLLSVQGGSDNFPLPPKVKQAFSKGLVTAALSTGAWILTDGINTGVSKYVGEAVKAYGSHDLRKRNTVGVTPWGVIDNHCDLIGRDVLRPYQPLGNPLSKRACLNGLHSHFLLVDDGTLGKHGCQLGLRRGLERHIQLQRIHPRLNQGVPVVCVVVEGGPGIVSIVLDYVSSVPPVPVLVFEGSGRAADLLAFLHKQTDMDRQLDADIQEGFLVRMESEFGVERAEADRLFDLLMECMDHRQSITIYDSESDDHQGADSAILTATLKGTKTTPAGQLSMALAWDRADMAKEHILVYGQHWQVGSLEQAMLDALVMDRVGFVKLLIDNGMTMNHFLTVGCLEELYNTLQGPTDNFLHHLVEDVKKTTLPRGYRLSLIDIGLVLEYLIGAAYCSTYTRKHFRAAYNRLHAQCRERSASSLDTKPGVASVRGSSPPFVYGTNDLFVWAVLQRRQQMALFLCQHGEEALARATAACKLYRSMAHEARQSNMDDSAAEQLKAHSLEFGQLAVDMLDCAFRQNERMAMKLLTSEMEAWSHFTCLQMAISSRLRPFVSHSCTQTLLNDLWIGRLNMRKNSFFKIILSLLLPPVILLLEFKSQAEMSHVPQTQEALQFGWDPEEPVDNQEPGHKAVPDAESGRTCQDRGPGSVPRLVSSFTSFWIHGTRRLYEFYSAPIVKFCFHTMSYLVFLMLFSYTVLVKMEDRPSPQEGLVIAYILATALEKIREVLMSKPRKLSQKLKVWFGEYWNISEFLGILLFLAGMALRWQGGSYREAGHIVYCLDIIFWFVGLLDLLAVNQHAGPYLTMITKMTRNMFYIVMIMAVVLLSFGVSRKAILSPDEEPSWSLARDVVFMPYWMMFGEVYAGEIDACAEDPDCPPGSFLTPFLQAVYLFVQYLIMVNLLIAFFNNVYFDMTSTANKLWKYNRYRYIMVYQGKPWLPPPLILLSHVTQSISGVYRKCRGLSEHEERGSGLKLYLGKEDRKRLHEFEERCVLAYFREKNEGLQGSQMNRIRATAERAEDMRMDLGEVSEKTHFIQESLSQLDGQLGQLQDLSALAVDTLAILSASDSLQQEEARLAHCQPVTRHPSPESWSLPRDVISACRTAAKAHRSTPPSPLRDHPPVGSPPTSLQWQAGAWEGRAKETEDSEEVACAAFCVHSDLWPVGYRLASHGSLPHLNYGGAGGKDIRDRTPCDSCVPSECGSHPWTGDPKPWAWEPYPIPSQEETSMDEEEQEDRDEEEVEEKDRSVSRQTSSENISRASSQAVLLSDPRDERGSAGGCVNLAFCRDDQQKRTARYSRKRGRSRRRPCLSLAHLKKERLYGPCRSLSSSVENMALSGAPRSPLRTSFPAMSGTLPEGRGVWGEAPLYCSRSREWSKSSDLCLSSGGRVKGHCRKTVKIQEEGSDAFQLSEACIRRRRLRGGEPTCWSASTSLSQLYFEPVDPLQKSAYQPMERNNLMRLAHTIPFTPVSMLAGEEVSIYTLEETESESEGSRGSTFSSWSCRGLSAVLQPLSGEGSLDGGLHRATRVLCTWAEGGVLRPGLVYVVKAFRPEAVRTWQKHFAGSTALQLCLREIQQQRAAQKLMHAFNQVKPEDLPCSPRFLEVSLVLWHSDGQWLTIERNMAGDFRKYNNKTGEEIAPCCGLEEMLLAFSHWTYEYTRTELLVLDIQGVGEVLTDPSVIRAEDKGSSSSSGGVSDGGGGEMVFGPANLGDPAIRSFQLKHTCNSCCHRLGLADLRRSVDGSRRAESAPEDDEGVTVTRM
ncbi:transient receptor potential cation channel subfamily M member 6 [Aplochiton taeniatus]